MFEENKIHVFMKRDTVDLFLAWQQLKEHAAPNWCKHQWNKSYKPATVQLFSNPNNNDRQNAEYITDSMDPPGCWQVDRCGTGSCYDLCQVRWCRPLFGRQKAIGVKTMISYSQAIYSYFDIEYLYSRSMINPWFALFWNRSSVLLSLLTFKRSVWNLQLVTIFGRSIPTWQGPNTPLTKQVTCEARLDNIHLF